jgi:SAM-dependent methyltransferase
MRLHVGSGSVYLREWVNVDLPLPTVFLARERPDLVERFITDETNYYGRHSDKTPDTLREGPVTGETCCDVFGSFAFLPARNGTVSEILSVQAFEHLDRHEAREALQECRRVLKPGGILRIDIPDADETIRQYRLTGDSFFLRHLYGPRKNLYGFHTHYTRSMLRNFCEEYDFKYVREEGNIHWYPSIFLRFMKK